MYGPSHCIISEALLECHRWRVDVKFSCFVVHAKLHFVLVRLTTPICRNDDWLLFGRNFAIIIDRMFSIVVTEWSLASECFVRFSHWFEVERPAFVALLIAFARGVTL